MRKLTGFDCKGNWCAATLDDAPGETGLLIVSGGNEIRSGAHKGQASLAAHFADLGFPVFRFDRRGIGESEGANGGFESSADDLAAALSAFRTAAPQIKRVVAFGNCDAATSLALFHAKLGIDALMLANPWVLEATANEQAPAQPSASAIRARYWARLKNPRSLIDLLTGKINFKKLAGGLKAAVVKDVPTGLSARMAQALAASRIPTTLLIADCDHTGRAFMACWNNALFKAVSARPNICVEKIRSASHGFADAQSRIWLLTQIELVLLSRLT